MNILQLKVRLVTQE